MTADLSAAIEAAGPALWTAPHLSGPVPGNAAFLDAVPLATGGLAVWRAGDELLVAPVIGDGDGVRRAEAGDGVFAALAAELTGAAGAPTAERIVGLDQTNESVIVGDALVVKLLRRTRRGAQPGHDLPGHLAAVGFTETPRPMGSFDRDGVLLATGAAYLPGAEDGWHWYVEMIEAAALGERSWDDVAAETASMGALVARFQGALATPSSVLPGPVGLAGADTIGRWHDAATATLDEALALTTGAVHERLRACEGRARAVLDGFARVAESPVTRIHGDLHVGQILRVPSGALYVSDLDGDPVAPVDGRIAPGSPARDVASMACALDHAGRVVVRRHPATRDAVETWIPRARATFLSAHRDALEVHASLFDARLLHPFAIAQEAHEFVYAARFSAAWMGVPDAALPAVLAWDDEG